MGYVNIVCVLIFVCLVSGVLGCHIPLPLEATVHHSLATSQLCTNTLKQQKTRIPAYSVVIIFLHVACLPHMWALYLYIYVYVCFLWGGIQFYFGYDYFVLIFCFLL